MGFEEVGVLSGWSRVELVYNWFPGVVFTLRRHGAVENLKLGGWRKMKLKLFSIHEE